MRRQRGERGDNGVVDAVGGVIAYVIDVGHVIALAPSVALGLMKILDWLYRRRTRRQRLHHTVLR